MKNKYTEKKATFTVEGYDSFSGESFPISSGLSLQAAIDVAKEKAGEMTLVYVLDENGDVVHKFGTY